MDFSSEQEKLEIFSDFIKEYKEKSISEKQKINIEELKELLDLIKDLLNQANIYYNFKIQDDMLSLNESNYDDVMYIYMQLFKDAFATYILKTAHHLDD